MNSEFWLERWQQGQIGFHQQDYNPYLVEYWQRLGVVAPATVFVPLCGKSLDLLWLRGQGYNVVGVEVAEQACEEFFSDNQLSCEVSTQPDFTLYQTDGIKIYCGDYFKLTPTMLSEVSAVYDRAAMVAMPPSLRGDYVTHLRSIVPPLVPLFLVTMEYDQTQMDGPPFAVLADEVASCYTDAYSISAVARIDVLLDNQRFRERGVTSLYEAVYTLSKK